MLINTRERLAQMKAVSRRRKRESHLRIQPVIYVTLLHISYRAAEICGINILAQVICLNVLFFFR